MVRFCDLSCPEASFPRQEAVDGAGSCRTFAALYCACLSRLVAKNAICTAQEQDSSEDKPGHGPRK